MAASKALVFIVFVLYLSCTLLVSLSGIQARRSCRLAADCVVLCRRRIEGCVDGKCVCEWAKPETELTKTIRSKKESERTLLVSVSGNQSNKPYCSTSKDCDYLQCTRGRAECVDENCICGWSKPEIELTNKTIKCKRDSECPDSRECPKDYYYSCLHGECTCIAV
ncbi:unnamed protein product [Thlaspi arvense]|uniref:Uncharacterized protein n=1 Tax=Thlaspi arvense TaxID=13288 RepID=A0AAU9SEJ5_THLAR|nr:unnamed protein product [Thlaspi arvense]